MSGSPTEAEIQTQWKNVVNLLESTRNFADGTVAGGGHLLDVIEQSLEGEYTPAGVSGAAQRYRVALASLIDPGRVREFLSPVVFEYGRLLTSGSGFNDLPRLARSLYEHFNENSLTVKSRGITFDTTATVGKPDGSANIGTGVCSRLTKDENGFDIESCVVETKTLRCVQDQNSGEKEQAEVFSMLGAAQSPDSLLLASFGSGDRRQTLRASHAGTGAGGSLLRNSSFSSYGASAAPKFVGWTETAGGANIAQDTTNYYRSFPNASVDASLKITGGAGTVTLTQYLADMSSGRLDPAKPYFLRIMVNKTIGSASGGSVTVRMGSQTLTSTIAALGSGWAEMVLPFDKFLWLKNFNQDTFKIEVEWSGSSSGYLLVDDILFTPWTQIDGTWWLIRQNAASPIAWLLDDRLVFTDTGGAPSTAKIQWFFWLAGFGYLPSTTGTPTFTDP